jgi:imidazolonepropionase-like amidohydrolase
LLIVKGAKIWKDRTLQTLDFSIENGKFKQIASSIPSQPGVTILNCSERFVYPGLIDPHTHVGIFEEEAGGFAGDDVNETSGPATPGMRAIDAINPLDYGIRNARNHGVTTVCIMPGSANVIGGEGVVIKTAGTIVDEMIVKSAKKIVKMAFGRNITSTWSEKGKYPSTRLAVGAVLREKLNAAKNYIENPERQYSYEMEVLSELLKKNAIARIHVANLEDIETISRIAVEYGFSYVLDHATALHTNPEFAKSLGVPVILGPLNVASLSYQTWDLTFESVKILFEAGVHVSIMTDAPAIPLNLIRLQMWLIDRYRMNRADVFDMFTINPAKTLGIDTCVGSIEEGKDADFIILDKEIFDYRGNVNATYINGTLVGGEEQ